jgi:hypothetical protein
MIDEESNPVNRTETDSERDLQRADTAARVRRHRARKELELEGLTMKKLLRLKAARAAESAATKAAAERTLRDLTPEQHEIVTSEVFREGDREPNWEVMGFDYLRSTMFECVALVRAREYDEVRADLCEELYRDFVAKFPFAKDMVYPRAWWADKNKIDEFGLFALRGHVSGRIVSNYQHGDPSEFSLNEFEDAVSKWRGHRGSGAIADMPAEVPLVKRGRGRPRKPHIATPAVDPKVSTSWTTPPAQKQTDHWRQVEADRVARAIEQEVTDAEATKPIVFDGM